MGFWDFVKDSGKSIFGTAEAAEPKVEPKAAPQAAPQAAPKAAPAPTAGAAPQAAPKAAPTPQHDAETKRKLDALNAEVAALGLDSGDVRLYLNGDTVKVESKGADRATMEKLILAVGNIQGIARVEADLPTEAGAKAADPVFHEVKKGETLSDIAKTYLGNANDYRKIFEANKPMLKDPDHIYPGQKLRIPQN